MIFDFEFDCLVFHFNHSLLCVHTNKYIYISNRQGVRLTDTAWCTVQAETLQAKEEYVYVCVSVENASKYSPCCSCSLWYKGERSLGSAKQWHMATFRLMPLPHWIAFRSYSDYFIIQSPSVCERIKGLCHMLQENRVHSNAIQTLLCCILILRAVIKWGNAGKGSNDFRDPQPWEAHRDFSLGR